MRIKLIALDANSPPITTLALLLHFRQRPAIRHIAQFGSNVICTSNICAGTQFLDVLRNCLTEYRLGFRVDFNEWQMKFRLSKSYLCMDLFSCRWNLDDAHISQPQPRLESRGEIRRSIKRLAIQKLAQSRRYSVLIQTSHNAELAGCQNLQPLL